MKKHKAVLILLSFLLLSGLSFAQEKTVNYPLYESNNQFLRIDKIEVNKDKTILHCAIRSYAPESSRIKLSSGCYLLGESGKKYELTGSKGINLDEDFYSYIPTKFTLTFKPLDDGEKIFHFFEKEDRESGFILANILTYKPEGVTPFKTTIKGTVVGIPECDYIVIYTCVQNYIQDEFIPVRNGKFELEREFNFSEYYYIATKEPNPLRGKGQLSTFCIEPGIIEVRMVANGLGENIIKGGEMNNYPDFDPDLIPRTEEENKIYARYKAQGYDAAIIDKEKKEDLGALTITTWEPYMPWSLSKSLLSEEAKEKLMKMRGIYESSESNLVKDSIIIELMRAEQSQGFYADSVLQTIAGMKEAEARRREEAYRYLAENSNSVKNLYYLYTKIFSIVRHRPQYSPFRASEFDRDPFHGPTDAEYRRLKDIVQSQYSDKYFYHPYMRLIRERMQEYEECKANIGQFLEACSEIEMTPATEIYDGGNVNRLEYEQFRNDIAIALQKKDKESVRLIRRFANEYAIKYPRHSLTNEIKKMIGIAIDDNNPNKWMITYRQNKKVTGFFEAMELLKKDAEQQRKEREDEKRKKKVDAKLMDQKKEL